MAVRHVPNGDFDLRSYRKGVCLACGSTEKEGHTGIFTLASDDYGRYDICESCVEEMADTLGWISPDKAKKLRESNRTYGTKLKAAEKQIDALQKMVTEFLSPEVTQ